MAVKIVNQTKNTVLAERAVLANTPWSRMRGLLGRASLPLGEGLIICGCKSIHMFFMRFPIDVIFVDRNKRIIGLVQNIPPFALSPLFWKAESAIELPPGSIAKTATSIADQIAFRS